MKVFLRKRSVFFIILILLFITACNGNPTQVPENSQIYSDSSPLNITYCNISSTDLCLEGFGKEGEDNLLILFKADNPVFADIYVGIEKGKDEIVFECIQAQDFSKNVYCSGDIFPNGENIQLNIYAKEDEKLIAKGGFTIQYGVIQRADDIEFEISTPESSKPSYPNESNEPNEPDEPNYPNSSYENPTATP